MTSLAESLPSWFRRTPVGKQVVQEAMEAQQSERSTHLAAIAKAEAEFEKVYPIMKAKFEKAHAGYIKLHTAMLEARAVADRAWAERMSAWSTHNHQVSLLRRALEDTAHPGVRTTGAELSLRIERARQWNGHSGAADCAAEVDRLSAFGPALEALKFDEAPALLERLNVIRAEIGLEPLDASA